MECSPNGQNGPRAGVCVAKDIKSYPTWDIGGKRNTGLMTLEDLAQRSGYNAPRTAAEPARR